MKIPTAELTIALILASLRDLPTVFVAHQEREWVQFDSESLAGKSVMLVGQGGLGKAISERITPFGVDLIRVASRARDDAQGRVHSIEASADLLGAVDIVILAVPLTPLTTGLVDARFLSRMRTGALLVNVARGPVVHTEALVDALQAGRIRAAIDVVDPEPLPPVHPLWQLNNCVITPHIGGMTASRDDLVARLVRAQLSNLVQGKSLANVVLGPGAS